MVDENLNISEAPPTPISGKTHINSDEQRPTKNRFAVLEGEKNREEDNDTPTEIMDIGKEIIVLPKRMEHECYISEGSGTQDPTVLAYSLLVSFFLS